MTDQAQLAIANNLSDLDDVDTALTNLGIPDQLVTTGGADRAVRVANNDWNDYTEGGYYVGVALTNSPLTGNERTWVTVFRLDDDNVAQLAYIPSTQQIFLRESAAGLFNAWQEVSAGGVDAGVLLTDGSQTRDSREVTGDWNTVTDGGFYYGAGLPNSPTGALMWVIVIREDATNLTQLGFVPSDDALWHREQINGVWTQWEQLGSTGSSAPDELVTETADRTAREIAAGGNLDLVIEGGFYHFQAASVSNSPISSGRAYLIAMVVDKSTELSQLVVSAEDDAMYERHLIANSWTEWNRYATDSELLTTGETRNGRQLTDMNSPLAKEGNLWWTESAANQPSGGRFYGFTARRNGDAGAQFGYLRATEGFYVRTWNNGTFDQWVPFAPLGGDVVDSGYFRLFNIWQNGFAFTNHGLQVDGALLSYKLIISADAAGTDPVTPLTISNGTGRGMSWEWPSLGRVQIQFGAQGVEYVGPSGGINILTGQQERWFRTITFRIA